MTATTTTADELPDYNGAKVTHCSLKFVGAGTGFSGLDVKPLVMELNQRAFVVFEVEASESASHRYNGKGELERLQRLTVVNGAPIGDDLARKVLQEHAAEVERRKSELDGQTSIDDELAAKQREDADDTDAPADIAAAAAKRAKNTEK